MFSKKKQKKTKSRSIDIQKHRLKIIDSDNEEIQPISSPKLFVESNGESSRTKKIGWTTGKILFDKISFAIQIVLINYVRRVSRRRYSVVAEFYVIRLRRQ